MSAKVDNERKEAAVEARTEAAKERLRLAQQVLQCFVEGLGLADTARRVGVSRDAAWRLRVWLGVQTGKQWKSGARTSGRRNTRITIEGVQP